MGVKKHIEQYHMAQGSNSDSNFEESVTLESTRLLYSTTNN